MIHSWKLIHRPRGLTLVEVLISTALLAVLASACLPLIARATRLLHESSISNHNELPEFDLDELSELADEVITDPTAFGLDEMPTAGEFTVMWKDKPEQSPPPVQIRILEAIGDGAAADHHWLEFRCQGLTVHRWRHIEVPDEAGTEPSSRGAR